MFDRQSPDDLALQAYLYASGELPPREREDFELRLALEQPVREALAEAVRLTASLAGKETRPAPAYRARVLHRLRPRWWTRVLDRRAWPGHPLLWATAGAAASLFLTLTLLRPAPEVQLVELPPATPSAIPDAKGDPDLGDRAFIWAELSTPDHVSRTHAEESRRKSRIEDRKQNRRPARY